MTSWVDYREEDLFIEDLALKDIAAQCGTPCYVYSQKAIEAGYQSYRQSFKNNQPLICYAVKANSNQAVLKILAQLGAGADVVSEGELQRALKAGIAPEKIVFSGTGKEAKEITAALSAKILQINIESESEFHLIAKIAGELQIKAPIAFRINPDVDAKTHAKISTGHAESKFGIAIDQAMVLYRQAAEHPYLAPQGLALHIGSQITDISPYLSAWSELGRAARALKAEGLPVLRLDAGGGLGITYENEEIISHDLYARTLEQTLGDFPLIIEPGRSIVGPAGILLTRILVIKKGKESDFAILDAGMNDLIRPALYESWHDFIPVKKPKKVTESIYELVGPICETGDSFASGRKMPKLQEGELLIAKTAGAYGAVMSSQYNSRPLIPEILVNGRQLAIIRPRESIEMMIARDILPEWL